MKGLINPEGYFIYEELPSGDMLDPRAKEKLEILKRLEEDDIYKIYEEIN